MAQKAVGSSPISHPILRIPEVRCGVSPIFFALKVELSAKNRRFASLRCFKAADFRLEPRTSCAFWWLPSLSLRLALRRVAQKAVGSSPISHSIFFAQILGKKNMKPVKASLQAAAKRRFMHRRCASYFCVLDTPEACKTQSAS